DLDFSTTLSVDELVTIVRGFYAGKSDTEIARELGNGSRSKTVARARIDVHLLRDSDTDAPFDLDALREYLEKGLTLSEIADKLDVSESTVRRYKHVVETQLEIRQVNDQYRNEFENILQDRELAEHFTENVREDGLSDATEGQETDVSL
ncbi:MAG: helix-turn-helix domain-containing protein, partial [Halobacteriaceae archaeon]